MLNQKRGFKLTQTTKQQKKHRSELDQIASILETIRDNNEVIISTICSKANMDWYRAKKLVTKLLQTICIAESLKDGKKIYTITVNGLMFLSSWKNIQEMLKEKKNG